MPHIFGNHMVLQQGMKLPLWGTADPGDSVTVSVAGQQGTATADSTGHWRVDLAPLANSATPVEVNVHGPHNDLKFTDVLIGDVWFCTGQSNMAYTLGNVPNSTAVAAEANKPDIHYFVSGHQIIGVPADDCPGEWEVITPENVKKCSAVAYFMAKNLVAMGHKPIGLIVTCWGGMGIQAFMGIDALKSNPAFSEYVTEFESSPLPSTPEIKADPNATVGTYKEDKSPPKAPSVIYDGMIHPIMPYGIKGIVWFHGASNTKNEQLGKLYYPMQVALINEWRQGWQEGNIPFLIEQINCLDSPKEDRMEVRNSQLLAAQNTPNVGLSACIDIGERTQAHFGDKADVGYRLAMAARQLAYGEKVVGFGPLFQSATADNGKMRVTFTEIGSGLTIGVPPPAATGGHSWPIPDKLADFELAGADGKWFPAEAQIDGDSVVVSSPQVTDPKAVRYAWANWPQPFANLYNKEGFPASPFNSADRG